MSYILKHSSHFRIHLSNGPTWQVEMKILNPSQSVYVLLNYLALVTCMMQFNFFPVQVVQNFTVPRSFLYFTMFDSWCLRLWTHICQAETFYLLYSLYCNCINPAIFIYAAAVLYFPSTAGKPLFNEAAVDYSVRGRHTTCRNRRLEPLVMKIGISF